MCRLSWILCASLICQSAIAQAATKKLLVVENLKTGNPYLSVQIKEMYENAIKIAEEDFKEGKLKKGSGVELDVRLDTSGDVAGALKKGLDENAVAIVGMAFTGDAGIATRFAEENKISFIAPAASFDDLFQSQYSRSLGISMSGVVQGMNHVLSAEGKLGKVSLVTAGDTVYDQLYAKQLSSNKAFGISKVHSFAQFEFPAGKPMKDLDDAAILTSYGHASVDTVLKSARSGAKATTHYLATSQWGYAAQFLEKVLKGFNGRISVVTDFYPLYQMPEKAFSGDSRVSALLRQSITASQRFRDRHLKMFKKEPFEFCYAIYDSIVLAHSVAANSSVRNKREFLDKLMQNREVVGASGPTVIRDGKFMPVSYVLEWKNDRFQMKEFSFDGAFWKVNL